MKKITEYTDNDCIGYFESEEQFNQVVELCNREFEMDNKCDAFLFYGNNCTIYPNEGSGNFYGYGDIIGANERNETIHKASEVLYYHKQLNNPLSAEAREAHYKSIENGIKATAKQEMKEENSMLVTEKIMWDEIQKLIAYCDRLNENNIQLKAHLKEVREEVRYLFDKIKPNELIPKQEKVKLVNSNGLVIEDYAPTLAKYLDGLVDTNYKDYNVKYNKLKLADAFNWHDKGFTYFYYDKIDDAKKEELEQIEQEFIKIKNL